MPEAHLGRLGKLLEPPYALGIGQEDTNHAGRSGREEGFERSGGRTEIRLTLFLDQHIVEGKITVTREI
jgi:hypothetical protein